ncbi:hypothetical protein N3K63_10485 [Microbacterium sp. W1N]|uniref:hypothetical protein n=1 Tax=Microbacterium festucae TaxID=2977531 RepID=UPI0021BE0E7B|nr:hypothetical protein [Microbacterium festucae]MCT9820708.1 hypothetical protein [Microbacterium festucae]
MSHDIPEEVPDGIVDADPAGGWGSAGTSEHSDDEQPTLAAHEVDDEAARERGADAQPSAPDGEPASDPFVESAEIQQGLDPDLAVHSETSGDAPGGDEQP